MATSTELPDPLDLLRSSIADNALPIPTIGESPAELVNATHLTFNPTSGPLAGQHIPLPLTLETRFVCATAGDKAIDLRSAYFCWINKDKSTQEYLASTQAFNDELQKAGKNEAVTNLVFIEKLDLTTYLSGESDGAESEYIRSLDGSKQVRAETNGTAAAAARAGQDVDMADADADDLTSRKRDEERLRQIYAGERKTGDRNTVLRGTKPQDFSDVRKRYSVLFFGKTRGPVPSAAPGAPAINGNPALRPSISASKSARRPEPIILLSPSASSLLRMSNIKSFLEEGIYTPDSSGSSANILHLTRNVPSISPHRPLRFIIVDDPSTFRLDYWDRLVAVFTTGQTWQFKDYKWNAPAELFSHALGIYVGWKGEVIPDTVKGWGRGVLSVQIDKGGSRWRDREVVEDVWRGIEGRMRAMGWGNQK